MVLAAVQTGIAALQDELLIQCSVEDVDELSLRLRAGTGFVITSSRPLPSVRSMRNRNFAGPLLADCKRYAGGARVPGSVGVSADWVAAQRAYGVTAPMTDSGYIGRGDAKSLITILDGTRALGSDVVALLPIAQEWLRSDLPTLVAAINRFMVPVAIVVEHRDDPFGAKANLTGLVSLLRSAEVPVLVLRSDTSALGALAFGATATAFGVRSSLRHLSPPGGFASMFRQAGLFEPGLYIIHLDRLGLGVAALPNDPIWTCWCSVCMGRTVDRLQLASSTEVTVHTTELLLERRDRLALLTPGAQRQQSWRAQCASAEFVFTSVAVTRAGWTVPNALRWWQAV